ncbi:MAG: transposase [Candidatus Parabeggiatoa sp.]|nr:transposase [Candidatus Parabeggiatoa sp.]
MQYRRIRLAGGTYFFTVNLAERSKTLLIDYVDILRDTFRQVKSRHPFKIDAIVVLPEHLHAIWTLPKDDSDYATRWMLIKSNFSRNVPKGERRNMSRISRHERGIWQRRYWEHMIRDEEDFIRHIEYIHYNPVKQGYVLRPADWLFSSIHRDIQAGIIPPNWGSEM